MNYNEESLKLHEIHKGKIEVKSKVKINTREDLSLAYTPGVAEPCRMIAKMTRIYISILQKAILLLL